MASHPYISGAGNITQIVTLLRKNFPASVNSDTVKKYGLASNNESYVINVLQFIGLIDDQGKRTEAGHEAMTKHDEKEFQTAFGGLVKAAYSDLFELRGDDAWTMNRGQLTSYFRSADKTSEVIGSRQTGVFVALRELAGYADDQNQPSTVTKSKLSKGVIRKGSAKQAIAVEHVSDGAGRAQEFSPEYLKSQKSGIALTVRIEINLPTEGTRETYDAIFQSIKANLYP